MKTHRPSVLALVGAVLVTSDMVALAQVATQLLGHVKSVDPEANRLVVTQTGTGAEVAVSINQQTAIATNAGKALTLKDLQKGDGVIVIHVGGVASRITTNPAPLTGLVESVDAEKKTMVVTQVGTDRAVTIEVGGRTEIATTEGKKLRLKDLKEGDAVAVVRDGDVARRIEVRLKPDELTGHVRSVAADLTTFVVRETGTDKEVTVAVNDDTTIVTTEGKKLKIKDLKKGDGVGITHSASVAKKIVVNVRPPER